LDVFAGLTVASPPPEELLLQAAAAVRVRATMPVARTGRRVKVGILAPRLVS
jgi:hypothetical protein